MFIVVSQRSKSVSLLIIFGDVLGELLLLFLLLLVLQLLLLLLLLRRFCPSSVDNFKDKTIEIKREKSLNIPPSPLIPSFSICLSIYYPLSFFIFLSFSLNIHILRSLSLSSSLSLSLFLSLSLSLCIIYLFLFLWLFSYFYSSASFNSFLVLLLFLHFFVFFLSPVVVFAYFKKGKKVSSVVTWIEHIQIHKRTFVYMFNILDRKVRRRSKKKP